MDEIKIAELSDTIWIYTPYNHRFIEAIKTHLAARWDPMSKCWIVAKRFADDVRKIMIDIYGKDDKG